MHTGAPSHGGFSARNTRAGASLLAALFALSLLGQLVGGWLSPRSNLTIWLAGSAPELAAVAAVTMLAFVIGIGAGAVSTLGAPLFDALLSRAMEIAGALPSVIVVFVVRSLYPTSPLLTLAAVLAVLRGLQCGKGVRAEVLQLLREDFVLASRALGTSDLRLFRKHVFPHVAPSALADATVSASALVGLDAAAAFLGLGSGSGSWGMQLSLAARGQGVAVALLPVLGISLTIFALWLISSGLEGRNPTVPRSLV